MAISTAAAIIGSAVVGAGASALSSASAAKKAANASNYAADQNAQVSREIYQQTRSDLSPYNQAGQAGLSALMQRLGLSPMSTGAAPAQAQPQQQAGQMNMSNPAYLTQGGQSPTSPMSAPTQEQTFAEAKARSEARAAAQPGATPQASQPDYAAYYAQNPDLQAEYARLKADPATAAQFATPEAYAQYHAQTFNDRPVPTSGSAGSGQPQYFQETYDQRPDALAVPTYQRPNDLSAPGNFSYTPQDIENDVGYQFARDQAISGVNAGSAARGLLRSGDAAKALQDRAAGVAHQWDSDYFNRALQTYNTNTDNYRYAQGRQDQNFIDDRSYGTNLWNTRQNRQDNIFSEDRGFAANRNDQATSNLFGLVGVGQNAAAGTAAAGNVFANNTINSNNQRAATTANAAIANAQNTSNLFGSAANAVGTYYGMRGLR